ncbi:MAG TPA: PSD1 and planctomycete cytochrome C domain-containing protein, partial [Gemmataceae bacterium]|nr:PSD1 and planctomycete cytochrome C domain-containing protein [Gemmataceae bacterium]
LDVEKDAKEAGVIVPGKPGQSALIDRITAKDEMERMPPVKSGKKLTPAEVDTLRRWVAEGAKWSPPWAYVPPKRHPIPMVKDANWSAGWTDRFVLARLEREKLSPSPDADRRTLCRRLYFDITGLPPTPDEVDAFVADNDPKAVEKLVDRLLASEHYGERMAMYWLDLVRYADTVGYHGDQDHHASPYRDYVIDAFNDNMPFDRFTREQLAGDLLPNPTVDQKIATCYNRLLQTSHEGGVQPKEYIAIYAADRVRNLSAVWMGATVGCAQCHDHKFDPYTSRDFYSLAAFFADVDEEKHLRGAGTDTVPTRRPPEIPVHTKRERQRLADLDARIVELEKQPADDEQKKQLADLTKQRDALRKATRLVMVTQAVTPRTVRVLPRGNWLDDSGPVVEPAVPEFLGKLPVAGRATRLDLANWLTDAKAGAGGLTARVFVNRLWYLFFGVGLSKSLDDFGGQGESPVHPELLDTLAVEFVESGWDVKHMVKLILTSRAYRQASLESPGLRDRDPENRLYARQGRWRLPAEMVRDNALTLSGLLVVDVGGGVVKPYQPAGYYRHLNFPKREYVSDTDVRQWRRGVYVHWQRQYLHPMLKAFDAPVREECTAQRPRSNTPLAALVLLNDPTFIECARVLAQRVLTEGGKADAERIAFAFRQVTSRDPDEVEQNVLLRVLVKNRAQYKADPKAAEGLVKTGLAPLPKDADYPELAAWTAVCRALLNLSETITRE